MDCVRWLGDYILSKSVNEKIMLWAPDFDSPQAPKAGRFSLINELLLPDSESVWFMRFGLDYRATTLACGNKKGQVRALNPSKVGFSGLFLAALCCLWSMIGSQTLVLNYAALHTVYCP